MSKKIAHVKVKWEDRPKRIEATGAREEGGQLVLFNGDNIVGRFPMDKVEQWSLEEEDLAT